MLPREPVPDQLDHERVVDEFASVEHCSQLAGRRCIELAHLTEHVAARDVREPVRRLDPLRLRALAGPLWTQDEDVHAWLPTGGSLRNGA